MTFSSRCFKSISMFPAEDSAYCSVTKISEMCYKSECGKVVAVDDKDKRSNDCFSSIVALLLLYDSSATNTLQPSKYASLKRKE